MNKPLYCLIILFVLCSSGFAYSFGQNKINIAPQDFSTIQTMHFDIYFPAGEDQFGRVAALMAEDIYYYIKAEFRVPILTRIPIIFYSTKQEFLTTNITYYLLTEGVGGFTESLHNRVVIPFEGSYASLEELLAHELTHAYINAMDNRFINSSSMLRPTSFPFWFSEGLPEYLSIGGEDDYNNMYLLDMVINNSIGRLINADGYLAYRLGESFLTFIAETWGREKVPEYFFAIHSSFNLDEATKKVFGMDFEDLESRWHYQLKRDYYPLINSHDIPMENFEQRTFHNKDGSYFNLAPRFSPNGSRYVYYSNTGGRYSIWLAGTQGLAQPQLIFKGEKSSKAEEFYYLRSALSWFPDNQRIAFSAKTATGDKIQILNVNTKKIVQTISIPELQAIYEADVSPDGLFLVLAGQKNMQSDLYLYEIETGNLTQLTNDSYDDAHPRFSPDGKYIAYDSEHKYMKQEIRYGMFSDLTRDIFTFNIETGEIVERTFDNYDCFSPIWAENGSKLVFLSYKHNLANYEILDWVTGQRAELTKCIAGIMNGDISFDDNYFVISNYFDGAWDIYFDDNPLKNLVYEESNQPQSFERTDDLLQSIDLSRLDFYGKRTKAQSPPKPQAPQQNPRRPYISNTEPDNSDSLQFFQDYSWDDKPDSISATPKIEKYKTRFALDSIWGGLAYSSYAGTVGALDLTLSDLLGNYGIGISLGISGKIENSNLFLSFMNLKHRADYGIGVYNFYDETLYRRYLIGQDDYFRLRERELGMLFIYRYPFSRFTRMEFDSQLYYVKQEWDYLAPVDVPTENWQMNISKDTDTVIAPGLAFVFDNALFGSTGPMVGWRYYYLIRKSFAKNELNYFTNYFDLRCYNFFEKRYSLAFRLNAGISIGESPQRFTLDGLYGVRALNEDIDGERMVLGSAELRFPFFDYISIAFPVPLQLRNIRGSIFTDIGAAWDKNSDFRGVIDGKLNDIKFGYGFGPRINLGYFVLKLDIAWLTDLSNISKPMYYLSLTEDF